MKFMILRGKKKEGIVIILKREYLLAGLPEREQEIDK